MKAAAYTRYGPPDVVQIMDVEKPVPKDNKVLIKVRAALSGALQLGGKGIKGSPLTFRLANPIPVENRRETAEAA